MIRACVFLFVTVAVGGIAVDATVTSRTRDRWLDLYGQMAPVALGASLPKLLRAQMLGTRALAEQPTPRPLAAEVAYLNALLACEYGLPTERLAREALARATPAGATPAAVASAGEAMLALCRGDGSLAVALARAAVDRAGDRPGHADARDARPLLVLGRAHLLRGELHAASRVLEAASLRAPGSAAALVGWAEARLGLGEEAGVADALREALRRAPGDTRALLLLEEAARASGETDVADIARQRAEACARDAQSSPVLEGSCELARAVQARQEGDRAQAATRARAAAVKRRTAREQALASLVLAHAGEVDDAAALLEHLPEPGEEAMPVRAWAQVAVALGRGEPPPRDVPPAPLHPETRLCAARAALAGGGNEALRGALTGLGAPAVAADPDLRAFAALAPVAIAAETTPPAAETPSASPTGPGPVHAFVMGQRALAAGDASAATRWLGQALQGHGDTCQALAGYLPALALTGRTPGTELELVRAKNRECPELEWVEDAAPQADAGTKTN